MDPRKYCEFKPKRPGNPAGNKKINDWAEETLAKCTGGARVAGSGSGRIAARPGGMHLIKVGRKGDVADKTGTLWESKSTAKASIRVTTGWLEKITKEAKAEMRTPGFCLSFSNMPLGTEQHWVILPLSVMQQIIEADQAEKA